MQTVILLVIIVGALALFATEKLRADLVAVIVTTCLALTGLVTVEQAFAGFSSPAVITVAAVFVLSAGLIRTGAAEHLTRVLRTLGGNGQRRIIAATVLLVGLLSSFMNNIGATILLMPAVLAVAREARVPSGRLLIPLAFGSLLGGLTTLIGTPPNLLISLTLAEHGYAPFRVFDFTPIGLLVLVAGALYLVLLGPRLLPAREETAAAGIVPKNQEVSSEVLVEPPPANAERAGQIVSEFGLRVLAVLKERHATYREVAATRVMVDANRCTDVDVDERTGLMDDTLIVEGTRDNLLRAVAAQKVRILAEMKHPPDGDVPGTDMRLAEATLAPRSSLSGKTLSELDFYNRYGLTVIAIRRHGESICEPLAELRLRFGDTLLLRGSHDRIRRLAPDSDFLLLEPIENSAPNYSRTTRAIIILIGVLTSAATGVLHISLATVLGAIAMVLSGCLRSEEVHRAIDWRTLIAIAGMIPLSTALETTGAATRIAGVIAELGVGRGPFVACALLGLTTIVLTQIMSNAAAAILVAPVGIGVAKALSISPHPILMIIAIAASTAFITPIGHQSNLLVYNAGGYRFTDFVRIGLPLTLLILALSLTVVPLLWPF